MYAGAAAYFSVDVPSSDVLPRAEPSPSQSEQACSVRDMHLVINGTVGASKKEY